MRNIIIETTGGFDNQNSTYSFASKSNDSWQPEAVEIVPGILNKFLLAYPKVEIDSFSSAVELEGYLQTNHISLETEQLHNEGGFSKKVSMLNECMLGLFDKALIVIDSDFSLLWSNARAVEILREIQPVAFEAYACNSDILFQKKRLYLADYLTIENAHLMQKICNAKAKDSVQALYSYIIPVRYLDDSEKYFEITFRNLPQKLFSNRSQLLITLEDRTDQKRLELTLNHKEVLLESILESTKDAVITVDESGTIELFSSSAERLFGYSSIEMMIENAGKLFDEDSWQRITHVLKGLYDSADASHPVVAVENVYGTKADGTLLKLALTISRANISTQSLFIITAADVTSFKTFIESVNDAYIRVDSRGAILDWNAQTVSLFEWSNSEFFDKNLSDLKLSMDESSSQYLSILDLEQTDQRQQIQGVPEIYARSKTGGHIIVNLTVWPQETSVGMQFNILVKDVTKKKIGENRLRYFAFYDSLTKLSNRASFLKELDARVNDPDLKKTFAVLFLDLDHFKLVNDTMGHDSGDLILIKAASRIKQCVRRTDIVSRLGGDEFTVLLDEPPSKSFVEDVAERINIALRKPFQLAGKNIHVSASIGITYYPDNAGDVSSLLKSADIAMYHVKEAGRDSFQNYNSQIHNKTKHLMEIESKLKSAIENEEFFLVFQPKVDVFTQQMIGVETLIRWNHNNQLISPVEFIPVAEKSGAIIDISLWVFQQAIRTYKKWLKDQTFAEHAPRLSVNVSVLHLSRNLKDHIYDICVKENLEPSSLELEITEGALMENIEDCRAILYEISAKGIGLSIDDFGTGYSSLQYLMDLPVDTLKVDRSFLREVATNKKQKALVAAVMAMAKSLELKVVLEGVETEEQLKLLKEMGCTVVQGYYFSKPVSSELIVPFMKECLLKGEQNS